MRFSGYLRLNSSGRRDRCDDRPVAREQPVRVGKGRVVVGGDEPRSRSHRPHRCRQSSVVEFGADADDHDIGRCSVADQLDIASLQLSAQSGAADDICPNSGGNHRRSRHPRRDNQVRSISNPVSGQLLGHFGRRAGSRVGDECQPPIRGAELRHRFGCSRHGESAPPDNTVKIDRPGVQETSQVGRLWSNPSRSPGPRSACAAAIWASIPPPYSSRSTAQ